MVAGSRSVLVTLAAVAVACGPAGLDPVADLAPGGAGDALGQFDGIPVVLASAGFAADLSCGPRGLAIALGETAMACAGRRGDGGSDRDGGDGGGDTGGGDGGGDGGGSDGGGDGPGLTFWLSDFRAGVYLFTGPTACRVSPGGRAFDAVYRGVAGAAIAAGGIVTLAFYDGLVARGSYDVTFVREGRGAIAGRLVGAFDAPRCD